MSRAKRPVETLDDWLVKRPRLQAEADAACGVVHGVPVEQQRVAEQPQPLPQPQQAPPAATGPVREAIDAAAAAGASEVEVTTTTKAVVRFGIPPGEARVAGVKRVRDEGEGVEEDHCGDCDGSQREDDNVLPASKRVMYNFGGLWEDDEGSTNDTTPSRSTQSGRLSKKRVRKDMGTCSNGTEGCQRRKHHKSGRCQQCEFAFLGKKREFKARGTCSNGTGGCQRRKHHKSGRCQQCEFAFLGKKMVRVTCSNGTGGCQRRKHHKSGRCYQCELAFLGKKEERGTCSNGMEGCQRQKNYKSGRCQQCELAFLGKKKERGTCSNGTEGCQRQKNHKSGRCQKCELNFLGKERYPRCGSPCCLAFDEKDRPFARYRLSEATRDHAGPRPDLAGISVCLDCLRLYDDTHPKATIFARVEHLVLAELEARIARMSPGLLENADRLVWDCPVGPSQRRPDYLFELKHVAIDVECDEFQHTGPGYSSSCMTARIAGLAADMGAPNSRSDRTAAVVRAALGASGSASAGPSKTMRKPLIFIKFNPDGYTDGDCVEHKSCFYSARDRKGNCYPQAEQRRFARRMDALAKQVVELSERYKDGPPDKEIDVKHMFYCKQECSCVHCSGSESKRAATRPERAAVYR